MSPAILALLALLLTIAIAYVRKVNTGILGIGFAFLVGVFVLGLSGKEVLKGFPVSIFLTLSGMMLLFSIARQNGSLDVLTSRVLVLVGTRLYLLPVVFFLLSAILSFVGPGPVVMVAIMAPLALSVGGKERISDLLMGLSVISGCLAGGLYRITASGYIAYSLGQEVGISNYTPVFLGMAATGLLEFLAAYFLLGGYRLKKTSNEKEALPPVGKTQGLTLLILLVTVLSIMVFKTDIALTAYAAAGLLLVLGLAEEKAAISGVGWSTLLLVCGMGLLVHVIDEAGGIAMLSETLSRIMTPRTATSFMIVVSGLMSAVSSASGVVMPTLIPTIPGIVSSMGGTVDPILLLTGIVVGSHVVTASPLSTLGAMTLGSANSYTDKNRFFLQLLLIAIAALLLSAGLAYLGFYTLFH